MRALSSDADGTSRPKVTGHVTRPTKDRALVARTRGLVHGTVQESLGMLVGLETRGGPCRMRVGTTFTPQQFDMVRDAFPECARASGAFSKRPHADPALRFSSLNQASSGVGRRIEQHNEKIGQVGPISGFAFPDRYHRPTEVSQLLFIPLVPRDVRCEFACPIGHAGLGRRGVPTFRMAMPETSVDEYREAVARQDDIGTPGEIAAV